MDFSANDVAFVSTITGHLALDEKNDEIASLIFAFLAKHSV
jgi:hypothetical protein